MSKRYVEDINSAWVRVNAVPSLEFKSSLGAVEYAVDGAGLPVLMSHGIQGSHAEGIKMIATYYGDDCSGIAPSRFGYFGSALPENATPALQADVYAELLDHLGIERAVIIGYSAGGPSAIAFGLRHPERVVALVLLASALPPSSRPPPFLVPIFGTITRTERIFWMLKTYAPGVLRRLMGVPKGYIATPDEQETIREVGESIFPVTPRRKGFVFDAFVGNVWVRRLPLEALNVATLIVHSADDTLAPYEHAVRAVPRIPSTEFVTLESGGHLFLSHEAEVRKAVTNFVASVQREREPAHKNQTARA
jgi:pimeloyl-ACP methyl ester carboxylesterase